MHELSIESLLAKKSRALEDAEVGLLDLNRTLTLMLTLTLIQGGAPRSPTETE